jgi:putative tryptophan/tyrosine transport system substrate-binding protein
MTPSATLAVHCGKGFDARFEPYQINSFEPIQCCFLTLGKAMQRREFITLLGGAAAAWPVVARAQQGERVRRIGILMNLAADDPPGQARVAAFLQGLQEAGWAVGRNAQIDIRWGMGDAERIRKNVTELVALTPDVIFATTFPIVVALQQATRAVPIVFAGLIDPVGAGLVASLARPGGNTTGFAGFEYGMSVKWLELLKQTVSGMARVAVLRDSFTTVGIGQLAAIQGAAPSFGVELSPLVVRDSGEIEPAIAAFARGSNGGLIVTVGTLGEVHRDLIIMLAARHRLPAVYPFRIFVTSGGLISYGPDIIDQFRRAATYVDRILKGEKPAELPVQQPTKVELAINLKTAKALGLTVPNTLLVSADEVIE